MPGVILRQPQFSDYKFGGVNGVYNNIYLPDGNWTSYLPTNEIQYVDGIETMSCVTQSAHNCLEIILKYLKANGLLDKEDLKFLKDYEDDDENVNFSDRFTANMSGTTQIGATLYNVGQSITNNGLLPERDWTQTKYLDWDDYYKEIPQNLKNKALKFLDRFNISYETVWEKDFEEAIKYSPLQVVVYAWKKNYQGFYVNDVKKYNHAVSLILKNPDDIFDTYSPFIKQLESGYDYWQTAYKYTITKKLNSKLMTIKENYLYKLVEGQSQIIALGMKGGLYWNDGSEGQFQTWIEFVARNKGNIVDKIISIGIADWNSTNHYDLKMNKR
jgi:hypothetical protein